MKPITSIGIALALTLGIQLKGASINAEDFQKQLEEFREKFDLSAMVVGVWEGEKPLFRHAFGYSQAGVEAELDMKFRAGGVCLTSVTAALLLTAEEGTVSIDDPIDQWMPDLPEADKVTLRMLANCTAGYGDYVPNQDFIDAFENDPFRFFSEEELIEYGIGSDVIYPPGTDWNYSHTNFVVLGLILEKIHGKTVPEILEEKVISPLALKDTVYTEGPSLAPPVLHSFTTERGIFEESTFWNPSWTSFSGSLAAPLDDVAKIIRGIGSASLITPASLEEMIAPTTVGLSRNTAERYYAMGLGVDQGKWLMQNPNFGGYQGIVLYNMETDLTMVAFVTLGQDTDPEAHHGMKILPILRSAVKNGE